jgi:hypothetical protein
MIILDNFIEKAFFFAFVWKIVKSLNIESDKFDVSKFMRLIKRFNLAVFDQI